MRIPVTMDGVRAAIASLDGLDQSVATVILTVPATVLQDDGVHPARANVVHVYMDARETVGNVTQVTRWWGRDCLARVGTAQMDATCSCALGGGTRPIFNKFRQLPQREMVQKSSHKLNNTEFSIGEQFPEGGAGSTQTADATTMKKAKADGKKANIVRTSKAICTMVPY
jgi:hypothetical protein